MIVQSANSGKGCWKSNAHGTVGRSWLTIVAGIFLALYFFLICFSPANAQTNDTTSSALFGDWSGKYSCRNLTDTPFSLELREADGGITGTFAFELAGGDKGSYSVIGRTAPDGGFLLLPGDWLERPAGYDPLVLQGRIQDNGLVIRGTMRGCGGAENFLAQRTVGGAPEAVAIDFSVEPVTGGVAAGEWEGEIVCGPQRAQTSQPLAATIHQDGGDVYAKVVFPALGPSSVAMVGSVTAGELSLRPTLVLAGRNPGIHSFTGTITQDGVFEGRPHANAPGCSAFRLSRKGEAKTISGGEALSGLWMGDYNIKPMDVLNTSFIMALEHDGEALTGELRLGMPVGRPYAEQDRMAVSLVPLHAEEDHLVLAPVGLRLAQGVYQPSNPRHQHNPALRAWLLIVPRQAGDALSAQVTHWGALSGFIGRSNRFFKRVPAEIEQALSEGKTPPHDFGPAIGGALAAATSMEDQCAVLAGWASSVEAESDGARRSAGTAPDGMPLFDDDRFVPIFGLPYAFLSDDRERIGIGRFMQRECPRRFDMMVDETQGAIAAFTNANVYRDVVAAALNRREADIWLEAAISEMEELGLDATAMARLDGIEAEAAPRLKDLTGREGVRFTSALKAKREAIEVALLMVDIASAIELPDEAGTLRKLADLANAVDRAPMNAAERRTALEQLGAKSNGIAAPIIAALSSRAAELPVTLASLGDNGMILREVALLDQYREEGLRLDGLTELARRLSTQRRELIDNPKVRSEFQAEMMAVEPGTRVRDRVMGEARRYLTAEELRAEAPTWRMAAEQAISSLELASIELVDISSAADQQKADEFTHVSGEPTAKGMAVALLDHYRNASHNLNNLGDLFPRTGQVTMIDLADLLREQFVGEVNMTLTYFRKIGCASGQGAGMAGYTCDYVVALETSNAQMAPYIPSSGIRGQGRFARTPQGWEFLPDLDN